MRFPLRTKLLVAISLPLLAVYVTVLAVEYQAGKQRAEEQVQASLVELAQHYALDLNGELETAAQVARTTAEQLQAFPPQAEPELETLLEAMLRSNPRIFGGSIALVPGALGPQSPACAPYVYRSGHRWHHVDLVQSVPNYARLDWYLLPKLLNEGSWTDPYFDEGAGNVLMCTYAVPLKREGKFLGVVTVDLALDNLRRRLAKLPAVFDGGYCMLLSRAGTFVSHPDESFILSESIFSLAEESHYPRLAQLGRAMIAGRRGVETIPDYRSGQPQWIVYTPVPSTGWSFAARVPVANAMRVVYERMWRNLAVFVSGFALMVFCILVVTAWITRPLGRLAVAAHRVASGDLTAQVSNIQSRDEIGQFAATFNQMVHDLKENVEATVRETAAREAMERELQVARQIQTSLLPSVRPPFPERPEFTLDGANEPARYMAGDFYDYWFLDDDVLALVIADVVGKGVPAAMFMAVSRTTLRNFSAAGRSPGATLTLANRMLAADNPEQMFVTVFYGHYHTRTGELLFANGGHNPPWIVRQGGRLESLGDSTGPIVGIWDDAEFEDRRVTLAPGELLVCYTDGVTEARNAAGDLLGDAGFSQLLAEIHQQPVDELCQTIVREVDRYRNHEGQDDVTLLALRRSAEPSSRAEASRSS